MKEFDFVKLTLWLAGVLTLAAGAGYLALGVAIERTERDIRAIEADCKEVGLLSKDIKTLEDEKDRDKTPDTTETGINTYFYTWAQRHGIEANVDYTLKPRDPVKNARIGFVDQQFNLEFKKDRPKSRDQIMKFIFDCETQSRRIKLQKAKLTLDPDVAAQDAWRADSLTFVRRDPIKAAN